MLNLDFDRICRLCLAKDEELVSIFNETEEAEGVHNISYRIESCTCLKLGKCDGLPGALCTGCLSKLDHIKEFQDQCQRSDRVLREYLQTKEKEEHRNTKERKLRGRRGHGAKKGERGKVKRINADRVKSDYTLQESAEKLETGTDWNDCETAITSAIDSVKDEVNFEATDSCKDTSTHVTHSQQGPLLGNQTKTVGDEFVSNGKGVGGSNHNHENGLDSDDNEFSWPGRLSDEECDPTSEGPNKQLKGNCATASSKPRKRAGKKYECEYCGRTFPRSNHLAQHELTHTKEKPFQCSYCQKGFWYKNSLTGHIKQTHTGDVNFTCDECGRGFFQKSEFMRHKPIHSNETPFKCDECDMSFKLMKNLKRHQKVHTATRTHTCQYCGKSFRMLQTLRVHLILHSGEKPYKCSYCGRGFSQSAPLKAHVRMHTGERPYICNLCGESFPTGSSLKSHVFKHTGIHPYSCKDCSLVFKRKRDVIDHRNKVHGGAETAPMQVPPQLPPVVEHTYTQEPTSHLNNQQPLHLQNHQSNHLSSAQIHQTLSHIDNVTSDVLDTLSEDSLSSDLVSHHQILQNEVSQVLAMSSPSHLMSPSLVKSDSDELITSDLNFV